MPSFSSKCSRFSTTILNEENNGRCGVAFSTHFSFMVLVVPATLAGLFQRWSTKTPHCSQESPELCFLVNSFGLEMERNIYSAGRLTRHIQSRYHLYRYLLDISARPNKILFCSGTVFEIIISREPRPDFCTANL